MSESVCFTTVGFYGMNDGEYFEVFWQRQEILSIKHLYTGNSWIYLLRFWRKDFSNSVQGSIFIKYTVRPWRFVIGGCKETSVGGRWNIKSEDHSRQVSIHMLRKQEHSLLSDKQLLVLMRAITPLQRSEMMLLKDQQSNLKQRQRCGYRDGNVAFDLIFSSADIFHLSGISPE